MFGLFLYIISDSLILAFIIYISQNHNDFAILKSLFDMEGKPVFTSAISDQVIEIDLHDLDTDGASFEGRIMRSVNLLAQKVATRHTGFTCQPLRIDSLCFLQKAFHGEILIGKASVNRTWPGLLEVGVKVVSEDFRSLEQKDILTAYFSFAALDNEGQIIDIPAVIPETPEQIQRYLAAERRYRQRLEVSDLDEEVLQNR